MEMDSGTNILDRFHELEKECLGYDNFVNCDDEHYIKTLEGLSLDTVQTFKKDSESAGFKL